MSQQQQSALRSIIGLHVSALKPPKPKPYPGFAELAQTSPEAWRRGGRMSAEPPVGCAAPALPYRRDMRIAGLPAQSSLLSQFSRRCAHGTAAQKGDPLCFRLIERNGEDSASYPLSRSARRALPWRGIAAGILLDRPRLRPNAPPADRCGLSVAGWRKVRIVVGRLLDPLEGNRPAQGHGAVGNPPSISS
jgi:hypothetical protein